MFSTLLCRSSVRAKNVESKLNSAVSNVDQDESTKFAGLSTFGHKVNQGLVWTICLVVLLASLQCFETKHLRYESKEGHPCICNQTFYQSCPKADQCEENKAPRKPLIKPKQLINNFAPYNPGPESFSPVDHDYGHPDHVDVSPPRYDSYDDGDDRFSRNDEHQNVQSDDAMIDDGRERVIRHRKVYVAKKNPDPIIHPIKLTIPVKVPEIQALPEPKPVYKLRKYTTYENRPEIKMVPVTKTIIKPAGLSPDQIISDSSDHIDGSGIRMNPSIHGGYGLKR